MAIATHSTDNSGRRLSRIDVAVRHLQTDIWNRRYELWNGCPPINKIEVLEPSVALAALGYSVQSVDSLGEFWANGVRGEAAGEINNDRKVVTISQRFLLPEQRFTLAHELGHAVCHQNIERMHRDLPLERSGVARSLQEVEANHFASGFLMPEPHMRKYFADRFLASNLRLDDEAVAYALCGTSTDNIRSRYRSKRSIAIFVAGTECFNGNYFQSLASLFRVTRTAMAIRLEELELIDY